MDVINFLRSICKKKPAFISKTVPKIGQNLELVFEEVSSVKNLKKYMNNNTIAKLASG